MNKREYQPLHPEECTHRSFTIAVDMAHMNARYLDTLSGFIPKLEMRQLQMNLLYTLIDIMGATSNLDPEVVLDECRLYFKRMERLRKDE